MKGGDHLSELVLARLCLDGAEPPPHVADCARCRQALEEHRAEAARFARQVFSRTLPAIEARLARTGSSLAPRRVWWAAAAAAALAGVVLWIALRSAPQVDGPALIAAKGGPALHLVARRVAGTLDRVFPVEPGAELAAGDAVRFVLDGAAGRSLLVVSVDGAGQINVYYPYGGEASGPIENQGQPHGAPRDRVALDGSIILDAAPGPERIWAVVSDRTVTVAELRAQLAAIAAGGAAAIRQSAELVIPEADQATAWFEKSPSPTVERIP